MPEEGDPRRKQAHPSRCSFEERSPDLILERADLPADRRLRDAQPLGGATDVSLFRDGDEILDLLQAHEDSVAEIETVLDRQAPLGQCSR